MARAPSLAGVGAGERGDTDNLLAAQRAYERLRHGILAGGISAGAVLDTTTVAEEFGMSRTPVREALQQLLQEGLVERGQRRQMVVRVIDEERHEIFLMREALESVVVQQAAGRISSDALDELRALLYRQRRAGDAGDVERFIDLDERFHLRLAEAAELPMFHKVLGELRAFIRVIGLDALGHPGRMDQVSQEHEAVLEALESRDGELGKRAMLAHLRTTEEILDGTQSISSRATNGERG